MSTQTKLNPKLNPSDQTSYAQQHPPLITEGVGFRVQSWGLRVEGEGFLNEKRYSFQFGFITNDNLGLLQMRCHIRHFWSYEIIWYEDMIWRFCQTHQLRTANLKRIVFSWKWNCDRGLRRVRCLVTRKMQRLHLLYRSSGYTCTGQVRCFVTRRRNHVHHDWRPETWIDAGISRCCTGQAVTLVPVKSGAS